MRNAYLLAACTLSLAYAGDPVQDQSPAKTAQQMYSKDYENRPDAVSPPPGHPDQAPPAIPIRFIPADSITWNAGKNIEQTAKQSTDEELFTNLQRKFWKEYGDILPLKEHVELP